MNNNFKKTSGSTLSQMDELLQLVQKMQTELNQQRVELEQQRHELAQLRQTTKSPLPGAIAASDKATSRRTMLRKLAAGAAGVAALGAAGSVNTPSAQAAGALNTELTNIANTTTTLTTNAGYITAVPLFQVDNPFTGAQGATTPGQKSIAIAATSASSFAIYGATTGSSTAPTGVIGVSGDNSILSSSIATNSNAGTVGSSNFNPGVVGLSNTNNGVEGRSIEGYGIKGTSEKAHGGAFANTTSGTGAASVVGATLRLGLKPTTVMPSGTAASLEFRHFAGEVVLDQTARTWVCVAGHQPSGLSAVPADPNFPLGPINQNGANWRLLPPLTFRSGRPDSTSVNDNQLHMQGELWFDINTGVLYVCTTTGSNNSSLWTSAGFSGSPPAPVFKPVGGNPLQFLPVSDRFVDTRNVAGLNRGGKNTPFNSNDFFDFQLTGVAGRDGQIIPTGAAAVVGNVTAVPVAPVPPALGASGVFKILPGGTPTSTGTSTVNFNTNLVTANAFNSPLDATGRVRAAFLFGVGQCDLLIDVVGYFLKGN